MSRRRCTRICCLCLLLPRGTSTQPIKKFNFDNAVSKDEAAEATLTQNELQLMEQAPVEIPVGLPASLVRRHPVSAISIFKELGHLRLNAVLSDSTTSSLLSLVHEQLNSTIAAVHAGVIEERHVFAAGGPRNRYDLMLGLPHPVRAALREVIATIRTMLQNELGPNPQLTELAAMVALPGATRQRVHADIHRKDTTISAFCALQDVDEDMGPTVFLPGSFLKKMAAGIWVDVQGEISPSRAKLLRMWPRYLGVMKRGDITLYEGTILHAGTANNSTRSRALFVFSFCKRSVLFEGVESPSLRKVLAGRYSLSDFAHPPKYCWRN
mmetsp:Transcript_26296/g.43635  ORF Transcript_26296/g.43635 Transcript_26296/m.43635 type:complete len:325 (-) Transcript_26296:36-1010(-)|eukprot:CAMPEP_0119338040 /NCGR_PEP_ID=MMETSP1333-20130426/95223_1 /TAXON_ID=418940 /ORGANISM="Scyphosphaera apsteinii, Strain RCC1455" /LENGTH=324 /DNA_ID=CAMNT_0007349223 /DNA_START=78 /DNA_END=1052 /DNA_ORIENTATION=-